jgi:DNA repair exonuclease SbcCD nuclease subunit
LSSKRVNVILGDPHVTVKNLEETERFFKHILETVVKLSKKTMVNVIIMGDGQHNHAVLRMEVVNIWDRFLEKLDTIPSTQTIYIVGNHDISGLKDMERKESSFDVFENKYKSLTVVKGPIVRDGMGFVPFTSSEEIFLSDCNELFEKGITETLFCHQTFQGNMYENGMYAPDGFNLESVPQNTIISGHIHKKQSFGKLISVGTWRWMTKSDANEEKGYHICPFDITTGKLGELKFFSSAGICTKMVHHRLEEGDDIPELLNGEKNFITLTGSSKWINSMRDQIGDKAIMTSHKTDRVVKRVEEKISSMDEFLDGYYEPQKDVTKKEVKEYIGRL